MARQRRPRKRADDGRLPLIELTPRGELPVILSHVVFDLEAGEVRGRHSKTGEPVTLDRSTIRRERLIFDGFYRAKQRTAAL